MEHTRTRQNMTQPDGTNTAQTAYSTQCSTKVETYVLCRSVRCRMRTRGGQVQVPCAIKPAPWALQQNTRGKPNSDNTKQRSNALSQVRGKSKLAPSWLCVLGHSSHQVLSLFSPLSLASSLCRPRMYDCRADLLAQC